MIKSLFVALGLVLVIEGILPFVSPSKWRRTILLIASQHDRYLRRTGLIFMIVGALIVIGLHQLT